MMPGLPPAVATPAGQWRFWLLGGLVALLLLWLLRGVLLPFVAAMAIAYLLDPLTDRLAQIGAPRWLATSLVLLVFAVIAGAALALLLPMVEEQLIGLVNQLPELIAAAKARALPLLDRLVGRLAPEDVAQLKGAAGDYAGTVMGWLGGVVSGLFAGAVTVIDVVSLLVITPVVAFYLLRDWDAMIARIDGWLPRPQAPVIRDQAAEVNRILAGFVRGQASVCLVLGLFYAVALTAVQLQFGLVIGLTAGLLSFVPYVGSLLGFVSSVGVALFQYDSWTMVGVVVAIFFAGQILEGYVLVPKLVGDRIGLHPVWVIFAIMAGGSLFGFTGVLLAVPVAAVVGVLVRFAIGRYLASPYFTGIPPV